MKTAYTRLKKELALLLIVAMVISMVGCKKKKVGTDVSVPSESETDITETSETETSETTTEPSESVPTETDPSVSIVTPSLPETSDTSATESTEPSETTLDPTATPTEKPADPTATAAPKPTKAPKETKKADPTPTNTNTPTPVPATATPTDTPTPTPTTAPARTKDAKDYMDSARSAVRQAIVDKCGWKTGFEFNDNIMANEKARAKYSINNDYFGHGEISGTVIPLEACGGIGCTYLPDTDQLQWYWTDYSGTNHYYKDDAYSCFYDFAAFLVVDHTEKLASDERIIYFGYGVSIKYTPWERSYGLGTVEEWSVSIYIGGDDQLMYDTHFPE